MTSATESPATTVDVRPAEARCRTATNAIAAILSAITLASVVLGYMGYRFFTRGERQAGQGMVGDMAAFDI